MNTGRNYLTRSLMVLQYYPMRWGMEGESHWHILGADLGGGELEYARQGPKTGLS